MKYKAKKIILLIGDLFLLYSSLYLALIIRYGHIPDKQLWQNHIDSFSLLFFVWIIIFYIFNLYNWQVINNTSNFLQSLIKSITTVALLSIAYFYLFPQNEITPKRNLLIILAILAIFIWTWRKIYYWILKSRLPKKNIAIVGHNKLIPELIHELKGKPHLGYKIKFLLDHENEMLEDNISNVPVIKNIEKLEALVKEKNISTIILGSDPRHSATLRSSLFKLVPENINFINLLSFYENITGKVPIELINQMWFLENLNKGNKLYYSLFKRSYDILLSLLVLIITLPFWPLIALIIKLESPGPVFILMERCSKNNKKFKMYKFRSMKEENNTRSITLEDDPRITKFGSLMRKTRIDEIPQIINILKGDMSFVGPRPERPELAQELAQKIPFFNERTIVNPGITGWDQISGEYHSPTYDDTLKKIQYDLYYIKNRSIYLDLSILLKTISTVLSKSGR